MHICTSHVFETSGIHQVCGVCWFVHEGCKCYSVDDKGIVMRLNKSGTRWQATRGMDLMDRGKYLGTFKTRREAITALRGNK